MGHYRNKCPRLANRVAMATLEAPNSRRGNGNQQGGRNGGRKRGCGRVARLYGRGRGQRVHVNAAIGE